LAIDIDYQVVGFFGRFVAVFVDGSYSADNQVVDFFWQICGCFWQVSAL